LLPNVQVPFGLRTVDGTFNHLVLGQSEFGSADAVFPRLTDPVFRNDLDVDAFDANGPAPGGVVTNTNYTGPGDVADADPRIISNLIVDQLPFNPATGESNPAASAAEAAPQGSEVVLSPSLDDDFRITSNNTAILFIPNVTWDVSLSASFNAWFTFFGQFFDHGLDLAAKGGSDTVFIPLKADDPLVAGVDGIFGNADALPASMRFMVLERATNRPGPDGILGTADDTHEHENPTSPFIEQNQTYTLPPSHQVFLRAYQLNTAGAPVATGKLIVNRNLGADGHFGGTGANTDTVLGGMATWAMVKAQVRELLGINLTGADFNNVPLLATDAYGNFIKGPHGMQQVVMKGADGIVGTTDDVLVEGNRAAPTSLANAVRTGHAFLNDIAHSAVPVGDHDGNLATPDHLLASDTGNVAGGPVALGFYDNELLDGEAGNDTLNGGAGNHVFVFEPLSFDSTINALTPIRLVAGRICLISRRLGLLLPRSLRR
jgi:hypothetical protein